MLENAVRICDAKFGNVYRWTNDALQLVAAHNTPPAYTEARRRSPVGTGTGPQDPFGRMIRTKTVVHTADLTVEQSYVEQRDPNMVLAVEVGGVRTSLMVPMLKEDELVGAFTLSRHQVRPFLYR